MNSSQIQQKIDVSRILISRQALETIPAGQARRFGILPVAVNENTLQVVLADKHNLDGIIQIEARSGLAVDICQAVNPSAVRQAIERYYPNSSLVGNSPLAMFEEIVNNALQIRSSDIHLDPEQKRGLVKMRVDGLMRVNRELSLTEMSEMVSAIKVASGLDIAEKRIPQDGQTSIKSLGEDISMRVATIPTIYGEKVTLRILATTAISTELTDIDGLGMSETHKSLFLDTLDFSHGIILLSGPTGSGKTTTLYAALRHLQKIGTNHIVSIEDPVEIPLQGINQVHVDSERVSFNKALRSTLRHDPDIIMIGEIRDAETADIAVKSALTGHLVLSTLHANDSVSVITRLLNLGVSVELVTSSLRLVISQRLVRQPCPHCVGFRSATEMEIEEFQWQEISTPQVPVINGCSLCGNCGYTGRTGLYEMVPIGRRIRGLIHNQASSDQITDMVFKKQKMPTLVKDGADKILAGKTTIEEVRRVTYFREGN